MFRLYLVLTLWCLTFSLSAQTARVQVIHNSPTPGADAGPVVDIYVNGGLLPELTAVPFRAASPFLDVPAGVDVSVGVAVSPSNSVADAIATFELGALAADETYVIIASGIVGDALAPFDLFVNTPAQESAVTPGNVEFAVFHGSPTAPAVDIDARGVGNLVPNIEFGDYSDDYISVAPGVYLIDVKPAGVDDIVASFKADLSGLAGGAATVFASGLLNDSPAFGLFAALPDGTIVELPQVTAPEGLVINEVDYDQPGTDMDEYIELKNTGTDAVDLLGSQLQLINGATDALYNTINLPDFQLAAGDYYVVCFGDNTADYCDFNVDGAIQNGEPDAIGLLYAMDTIDRVSYAGTVPGFAEGMGTDLDDIGDGGISRFPDGTDTDQNNNDFVLQCSTPGFTNDAARLQIIHNSPTPTVDIYVNGALYEDDFAFRTATEFRCVPPGVELDIAIAPDNSTSAADAIFNLDDVVLNENTDYVVVANGIVGDVDDPFGLAINAMARGAATDPAKVDFAAFHGSPDAPNVDIDVRLVGNIVPNLAFGEFSPYVSVDPAVYYVDVRAAGDPNIVATFEADLSALAGGAATVFASGFLGDTPAFGLFAALPDGTVVELPASPVARLQLIHNSPSPTVDIYVNGALFEDDFAFRTATEFRFAPAGVALDIAVAPDNSSSAADAIATFPGVVLDNGETYVVVANGVVGDMDKPFDLAINAMGREVAEMAGNVDFNAFHGSPDAPNVDIDVRTVGNIIPDLAFGAFSEYISVPPALYYVDVRAAGDPNIVGTFAADLTTLADSALTVFASGFLGDTPGFGLFAALPSGAVVELPAAPVARLQLIHNSPSPTVDVYVNGALFEDDFVYLTATAFRFAPAGVELDIAIAPGNSTSAADAIATFEDIILENGSTYVVVANGIVGDADFPFNLEINAMARETSTDENVVDIAAFHGSPGAPNVNIGEVDLGELFMDVSFGSFTDYASAPGDFYAFEVFVSGTDNLVGTFLLDLSGLDGNAVTVIAGGFVDGSAPAFNLYAVLPDGTVEEALPVSLIQIIHNSPVAAASAVDVYVGTLLLESNFEFRNATGFFYLPTRLPLTFTLTIPGTTNFIAQFDPATLLDGKNHVVIVNGNGTAEFPLDLAINTEGQLLSEDPSQVDVSVFHGSPGAPGVDVTAVGAGEIIDNLEYGNFTDDYLALPPDQYFLEIRADGSTDLVATFSADISPLAGFATTVFASGLLGDDPAFGLFAALPNGVVVELIPVSKVQIIHNSPSPTVDIYAGDTRIADDVAFRTATPYTYYPTRVDLDLSVAPDNSTSSADAIANFPGVVLNDGQLYSVVAYGIVGDPTTPFDLAIYEGARETAASGSGVDLLFFHGSPGAPQVDVVVDGGSPLFDNVDYGFFADYQNVPAAAYTLNVTPAEDNATIVAQYNVDISAFDGAAATVFASGILGGDPGFQPCTALPDGTVDCDLFVVDVDDLDGKVNAFVIAPNPTNNQAVVSYSLTESLDVTFNIFDATGQLISSERVGNLTPGEYNHTIDASQLAQGMYNYTLATDKGAISKRFIVVR